MLNHRLLASCLVLMAFLTAGFPSAARAQMQDQQAAPPATVPTVTGIHVDKTAKNAVIARAEAIVEAQRTAFAILAQKSMSPADFKTYKMPDDETIEALVRDFQISNEQMSSNRYVADFTVRFTAQLNDYIMVPPNLGVVYATPGAVAPPPMAVTSATPQTPATATTPVVTSAAPTSAPVTDTSALTGVASAQAAPLKNRNILVLPYLERADGSKMLWDDPNPWRDAWQNKGTTNPVAHLTITVPLGDLTDVSSGDPNAVWRNDYRTIEELRANYNATSVAVVLAHMSPSASGIDIYMYRDGIFTRIQTVLGTFNTAEAFKKAVPVVINALENPQPYGATAPAVAMQQTPAAVPQTPLATPVPLAVINPSAPPAPTFMPTPTLAAAMSVDAMMQFSNFSEWMKAQKRLSSVSPSLEVTISSITTHNVEFSISFTGTLSSLKTALAGQGLELNPPLDAVSVYTPGGAAPKTVYQIRLASSATPAAPSTPAAATAQ